PRRTKMADPLMFRIVMLETLTRFIRDPSTVITAIASPLVSNTTQLAITMSSIFPAVSVPILIPEAFALTTQLVIVMLLQDSSGEKLFKQIASSPLLIKQSEILTKLQSTKSNPSVF